LLVHNSSAQRAGGLATKPNHRSQQREDGEYNWCNSVERREHGKYPSA
jgi:hypothetical protein